MNRPAANHKTFAQYEIAALARAREDAVANNVILRHSSRVRLTHWFIAVFFFLSLMTGFVIYTPFFYGLAGWFGGAAMVRQLHPWFALAFAIGVLYLYGFWNGPMRKEKGDEEWKNNFGAYIRYESELQNVGKYNAGQKIYFWAVVWGAIALLVSGIVMWFPTLFPFWMRALAIWLHEITFFAFVIGIIYHIYMSTTAMPGTLRAMTRGTVTRDWAKWHHPRWYREIGGERKNS